MTPTNPEHLQLLSDKKLDQAAHDEGTSNDSSDSRRAMARAARYEQRRRNGDVPVSDRYGVAH